MKSCITWRWRVGGHDRSARAAYEDIAGRRSERIMSSSDYAWLVPDELFDARVTVLAEVTDRHLDEADGVA